MSENAVVLDGVRKEFPGRRTRQYGTAQALVAVDGVTFAIKQGEIFGLLGPNGAGKTTTIKIIATLLRPTAGRVVVAGVDVVRNPTQALLHLGTMLTGERSIYWKLTGRENLEYFAALYGLPRRAARERTQSLLERFALAKRADELVERYSTGMRQRICLAKAILAEPEVLILDEPTAGLDPQSARNLRELIGEISAEGRTVLLTTHYMEEADQLCGRVAIIDRGKIVALDAPGALKDHLESGKCLEAEVANWTDGWTEALMAGGAAQCKAFFDANARTWRVTVHLNGGLNAGQAMAMLAANGAGVRQFALKTPSLEDVFISLTGKSLRE